MVLRWVSKNRIISYNDVFVFNLENNIFGMYSVPIILYLYKIYYDIIQCDLSNQQNIILRWY